LSHEVELRPATIEHEQWLEQLATSADVEPFLATDAAASLRDAIEAAAELLIAEQPPGERVLAERLLARGELHRLEAEVYGTLTNVDVIA
jgi:hypothetical protein